MLEKAFGISRSYHCCGAEYGWRRIEFYWEIKASAGSCPVRNSMTRTVETGSSPLRCSTSGWSIQRPCSQIDKFWSWAEQNTTRAVLSSFAARNGLMPVLASTHPGNLKSPGFPLLPSWEAAFWSPGPNSRASFKDRAGTLGIRRPIIHWFNCAPWKTAGRFGSRSLRTRLGSCPHSPPCRSVNFPPVMRS